MKQMPVNCVLRASRLTLAPSGEHSQEAPEIASQTQLWSRPRMEGNSENLHSIFPRMRDMEPLMKALEKPASSLYCRSMAEVSEGLSRGLSPSGWFRYWKGLSL